MSFIVISISFKYIDIANQCKNRSHLICLYVPVDSHILQYIKSVPCISNRWWWQGVLASGSVFNCRSGGSWFESYTGLTWISLGTRNESPRFNSTKVQLNQGANWYPERAVSVQAWYFSVPYVGCKQTGNGIVSPGRPEC